nr:hypothetical protein GCM10025732_44780 [Glycomyces mayteni]
MRFSVLGPLRVETGGRTVPLGGPRQRAVLAALLTAPDEPVSRARIMDLVWDDPTPSAGVNLRGYVSKLRAALHDPADPEPRIVWDQGLRLRVAPGELDVWEFDLHAAAAQRARDEGRLADAAEAYRAALALVRAEPFQDVEGSSRFEEVRTPLRERRDLAFERYVAAGLDLGRHADLVGELRTWHARQPLWEHLAAQLMLALFRSGRRSEALAVFQETSETLMDELGTGPDRELRLMHRRILADDPGLQPAARARLAPVPRQLPAASAHFTGRATELDALDGLLADGGEAVAVLSGPGGIGKTALALHWAHRVAAKFPDGQIHLDLRGFDPAAAPMDPGEALHAVLDALGVPAGHLPEGADARSALLRSTLADKRVLMVLDNARDAAQVRPLLPGTAGVSSSSPAATASPRSPPPAPGRCAWPSSAPPTPSGSCAGDCATGGPPLSPRPSARSSPRAPDCRSRSPSPPRGPSTTRRFPLRPLRRSCGPRSGDSTRSPTRTGAPTCARCSPAPTATSLRPRRGCSGSSASTPDRHSRSPGPRPSPPPRPARPGSCSPS